MRRRTLVHAPLAVAGGLALGVVAMVATVSAAAAAAPDGVTA
jgi:hypothetical protein